MSGLHARVGPTSRGTAICFQVRVLLVLQSTRLSPFPRYDSPYVLQLDFYCLRLWRRFQFVMIQEESGKIYQRFHFGRELPRGLAKGMTRCSRLFSPSLVFSPVASARNNSYSLAISPPRSVIFPYFLEHVTLVCLLNSACPALFVSQCWVPITMSRQPGARKGKGGVLSHFFVWHLRRRPRTHLSPRSVLWELRFLMGEVIGPFVSGGRCSVMDRKFQRLFSVSCQGHGASGTEDTGG
jgi:hypothetical protein